MRAELACLHRSRSVMLWGQRASSPSRSVADSGAMAGAGGGVTAAQEQRWDVALSFAGAQREYVDQVAQALKGQGVRCFYDADDEIELWGKYLAEELPVIYGERAAAVVMLVSAEYAARDWTRLERRAALARAVRERREYVLPARFDDMPLPGLPPDMSYVDLRAKAPHQFAAMIVPKLAALGVAPPSQAGQPAKARGCGYGIRPAAHCCVLFVAALACSDLS